MPRVVLLSEDFSPYVSHLSQALTEQGHEVHVLTSAKENIPPTFGKVNIHKIMTTWNPLELQKITLFFQKIKPELMHILYEKERLLMAMLPEINRAFWKIPVITTLLRLPAGVVENFKMLPLLQESDQIVLPLESMIATLEKRRPAAIKEKFSVVTLGAQNLNSGTLDSREKWDLTGDDFVIGFFGFIDREKDFSLLLKAAAPLMQKNKTVKIFAVSSWEKADASFRQKIKEEISSLGISAQVIFTGKLNTEDLPGALKCFDLAVFPSQIPIEKRNSKTLREILATGIPTLSFCSDQSYSEFSIAHGENIWLIPISKNPEATLLQNLGMLMDNQSLRDQIRQGASIFASTLSFDTIANFTSRLYAKLLTRKF